MNFLVNKEGLQQVYFNLFKNALEAAGPDAPEFKIAVKIHKKDGAILIEIEDNGPGIPADILEKLGQEVTTSKKGGGGIGLIISREIVESHGGQFKISSTAGQGTTVLTSFPVGTN